MILDFDRMLLREIRKLSLPTGVSIGNLDISESLAVDALPGGMTIVGYYDGVADKELPYEIRIKTKDQEEGVTTLTSIAQHLESLSVLESENGSFDFNQITVASAPFFLDKDEQGYWTYIANINAQITVYNKKEVK